MSPSQSGQISLEQAIFDAGFRQLTADQARVCARMLADVMEARIGRRLSAKLTQAQMSGFERVVDSEKNSDVAASRWLEQNIKDYRTIIRSEFDLITERLRAAFEIDNLGTDLESAQN